ncbi:MAG: DUF4869 domain-containing protein [Schaedlerella sp.]|uniref:DUF4869 domain-containing protein n=1 Tax=Schaedlerella sp. TaxID=2676057 RepID=UPI0035270051
MTFKLLVVDDEAIMRKGIANFIDWDSLDCQVAGTAGNGIEAIQDAQKQIATSKKQSSSAKEELDFGYDTEAILSIDKYFNNTYDEDWLDDPFVKEMVLDIDHSEVLDKYCIQSPVLGQIPPEKLSGGVKALICMYELDDFYVDLIVCGKNCEKWIAEIAEKKDFRASMSGYDLDFEDTGIRARCLNDGSEIHSSKDWILKMCRYVGGDHER